MRGIIQRVVESKVEISGETIAQIGKGFTLLLGIKADDTEKDMDYIIQKTLGLRVFEDGDGKMNLSLEDIEGELLVVSQFTLYGDCRKGRRPSFSQSGPVDVAKQKYERFVEKLKEATTLNLAFGQFQADMQVYIQNDGPVTLLLDSEKNF